MTPSRLPTRYLSISDSSLNAGESFTLSSDDTTLSTSDTLTFTIIVTEQDPPTDNYTPLEGLRVSAGRVQYSFFSAGGCIRLSNTTINGVTYTVHSSKWQRRADTSSPWEDVADTEEQGGLCSYNPTSPGEYRMVADITIGNTRGSYSSENTIVVN